MQCNYELQITSYEFRNRAAVDDGMAHIADNAIPLWGTPPLFLRVLCGPKALTQRAQRSSVFSVLEFFNAQRSQRRRRKEIMNH